MKMSKYRWLAGALMLTTILSSCTLGKTPVPTQDVGAIQTQAFSIVQTQSALQQTQSALANPSPLPTNTLVPLPSPTLGILPTFAPVGGFSTAVPFNTQQPAIIPLVSPIPTLGIAVATRSTQNGCNDGAFVGETAPMDQDVVEADKKFSKGWTLLNTGTCTWDEGYSFAYLPVDSSPDLKGYSIVISSKDAFTEPQHSNTFIVKLTAPKSAGEYKGYWRMKDEAGAYFGPRVYVWFIVK